MHEESPQVAPKAPIRPLLWGAWKSVAKLTESPPEPETPVDAIAAFELPRARLAGCSPTELRAEAERVLADVEWQKSAIAAAHLPSLAFALDWLDKTASVYRWLPLPFEEHLEPERASLTRASLAVFLSTLARLREDPRLAQQHEPTPSHALDYVVDREIPREIRRALYERDIGTIYLLAVLGAAFAREPFSPEVTRALYNGWVNGLRQWLDMLAQLFGVPVPPELRESVDWGAAFARHEQARHASKLAHERFVVGGREPTLLIPSSERK